MTLSRQLSVASILLIPTVLHGCGGSKSTSAIDATPTPKTYARNMLDALSGAAIERTRGDMNAIASAMAAHGASAGEAPPAADFDSLVSHLAPTFIKTVPRTDAWSRPFVFQRRPDGWSLIAPGADALPGTADDIVMTDQGFTQLPQGFEPNFSR